MISIHSCSFMEGLRDSLLMVEKQPVEIPKQCKREGKGAGSGITWLSSISQKFLYLEARPFSRIAFQRCISRLA